MAKSVIAKNNPLTSRVIVNRLWGWHFGNGIVRTPSNFGVIGDKPTHPILLDWLAFNFCSEWMVDQNFHKLIMLSSTWQMSSDYHKKKFDIDGDNKLLWRYQPKKLEVEVWRDSLLFVTDELDQSIGGAPEGEIMTSLGERFMRLLVEPAINLNQIIFSGCLIFLRQLQLHPSVLVARSLNNICS